MNKLSELLPFSDLRAHRAGKFLDANIRLWLLTVLSVLAFSLIQEFAGMLSLLIGSLAAYGICRNLAGIGESGWLARLWSFFLVLLVLLILCAVLAVLWQENIAIHTETLLAGTALTVLYHVNRHQLILKREDEFLAWTKNPAQSGLDLPEQMRKFGQMARDYQKALDLGMDGIDGDGGSDSGGD